MKKHLRNWLGLFCFALLACLWGAAPLQATGNTVLVLPFQVTAGPEMPNAARDVPQIIGTEMQQRGLSVIPMDKARSLLSSRGGSIDMAALQSLLVPVNEGQARPANFDRSSLLSLNECAAAMAGQASGMLAGADAPAAAPAASSAPRTEPTDPIGRADFVPMGTAKGALADVQVRGLQVMDPEVVLMRLSIRKGDTPSANDINEEVKRIWELGYFSDVQAHMEGNVLVFTVAEKPRIENIIVEGNHEIDAEDVIAAMGTKSGNVLNEQLIADDLQKINELYRKEGYYLARSSYRLDSRSGGRGAVLVIQVEEGNKLYIKEVKIDGLEQLDKGDMDKYLALKPRNIFSWFTGTGVLKEEHLERDTNAIAAYGLNQGFVDIQVAAPDVQYKEDGIYVTFKVHEGPRYKIREIKFGGDIIDEEQAMLDVVEMDEWKKDNDYFSITLCRGGYPRHEGGRRRAHGGRGLHGQQEGKGLHPPSDGRRQHQDPRQCHPARDASGRR